MAKRVIVVDDFATTRKVIASSLTILGIEVVMAGNGLEAKAIFDGRNIDLLITDLNMPEMDGIDLAKFVRSSNMYSMLPILMLTTEIKKGKKENALNAGVTAILGKPYNSDDFLKIVKKMLRI